MAAPSARISYYKAQSDRECDTCSRKRRGVKRSNKAKKYATFCLWICRDRWALALCRDCLLEMINDMATIAEKID